MVPVAFFRNLSGEGFLSPLRCPKVLVAPYSVCAWSPSENYPPRLATLMIFYLQVVWKWFYYRRWSQWEQYWKDILIYRVVLWEEECTISVWYCR